MSYLPLFNIVIAHANISDRKHRADLLKSALWPKKQKEESSRNSLHWLRYLNSCFERQGWQNSCRSSVVNRHLYRRLETIMSRSWMTLTFQCWFDVSGSFGQSWYRSVVIVCVWTHVWTLSIFVCSCSHFPFWHLKLSPAGATVVGFIIIIPK